MDSVYLIHVHRRLLEIAAQPPETPVTMMPLTVTNVRVAIEVSATVLFRAALRW